MTQKILSGQKTTVQANVALAIGATVVNDVVFVKAHPSNTANIFVGNNGSDTVTSGTGYPLAAGDVIAFDVGDLGDIFVVSASVGQTACWALSRV
jgi:hypothetical protein